MSDEIFAEAARMEREAQPGVLCTVVRAEGSTPRGLAARMIVYADGRSRGTIGGGAVEAAVTRRCASAPPGTPEVMEFDLDRDLGMACGGRVSILLEPLGAAAWMVVFGAGHVARALAPLAVAAGFRIAVVDDLPERVTPDAFPHAEIRVASLDPSDWSDLPLDTRAYCVSVTRGHGHDLQVLRELVGRDLAYLGMIGSRRKAESVLGALADEGVPEARLRSVRCPIGLDIGAETPAEIAVSILAEAIAVRRRTTG